MEFDEFEKYINNLSKDTFVTEFIERYPFGYIDCMEVHYSLEVDYSGLEREIKPGGDYYFFYADPKEKGLFRAEKSNIHYEINLLKNHKTFKYVEKNYPQIYNSIKFYEFDDNGGIYVILVNDSNAYYFKSATNVNKKMYYTIDNPDVIKRANKLFIRSNSRTMTNNFSLDLFRNNYCIYSIPVYLFKE